MSDFVTTGSVSEATFEFTVKKLQQINKHLAITLLVLVILFVAVIGGLVFAFFHYEQQFDTEYFNVSTDKGGDAVYNSIGESGDIVYGTSDS